jgi:hypothetical protein
MNYHEIKRALADPNFEGHEPFDLLRRIAEHINDKSTTQDGRDLVIRALARRDRLGDFETQVLMSLVRAVGLYPYMTETLEAAQVDDRLAYELHRAEGMEEVFHSLQAKVYYQLRTGSNVVLSASTSVGKSLLIDAMIALGDFKKVVIIVPTLALIDETRKRLARRFRDRIHIITHPTQSADPNLQNVYILTQERVRGRIDLSNIDFFVVDEFYKLDFKHEEDKRRAIELNLAFHQLASTGAQFYLLGPNVDAIKGLDRYELHFIPSEYSTVAVDVMNFDLPMRGEERDDKLVELCTALESATLVYCQAPGSAARVAERLIKFVAQETPDACAEHADWMDANYHPEWVAARAVRHGVGLHHGGIPRALQQQMVRMFNEGVLKFLICTSTLIEGVNTAAENVIVYDRRRNKNVLDFFTYKNIQGRAGRMGRYFVGKVYILEKPPVDAETVVDYPVGGQDMDTPLSLIMQLDEEELTELSKARVAEALKDSFLSEDTIRINGAVDPNTQNLIARAMHAEMRDAPHLYNWKGFPKKDQLIAVGEIIVRYLSGPRMQNLGISSSRQLHWHLTRLGGGIQPYLQDVANGVLEHQSVSAKIDEALKIVRNIIGYSFPQDLMVVHHIQAEVARMLEVSPGDYSVYADAAKNLFLPEMIGALDEYGIPLQIATKLSVYLEPLFELDAIISRLRTLDVDKVDSLTPYERQFVKQVQETL